MGKGGTEGLKHGANRTCHGEMKSGETAKLDESWNICSLENGALEAL